MIIPQDNITVAFKNNGTPTYIDTADTMGNFTREYYNIPYDLQAIEAAPLIAATTISNRYNKTYDEYHLFDFCIKLRDLFKDHFEHGDVDISDDEFWEIIKA